MELLKPGGSSGAARDPARPARAGDRGVRRPEAGTARPSSWVPIGTSYFYRGYIVIAVTAAGVRDSSQHQHDAGRDAVRGRHGHDAVREPRPARDRPRRRRAPIGQKGEGQRLRAEPGAAGRSPARATSSARCGPTRPSRPRTGRRWPSPGRTSSSPTRTCTTGAWACWPPARSPRSTTRSARRRATSSRRSPPSRGRCGAASSSSTT